jgi:hypothetical protein
MPRVPKIAEIDDSPDKPASQSSLFGNSGNLGNGLADFPSLRASDLRDAVNYRICELCQGRFLADSSNSKICSRPLCKAVRMATQHRRSREQRR